MTSPKSVAPYRRRFLHGVAVLDPADGDGHYSFIPLGLVAIDETALPFRHHSNLVAVRHMRSQEKNDFDAIVVAGDIGNDGAAEFFKIMQTFKCPILYVYGNWDHALSYRRAYVSRGHLLHMNVIKIGRIFFTGFSGCPTNWGKNPLAQKPRRAEGILDLNKKQLAAVISKRKCSPENTVVVTHERLSHLAEIAPNALLHLFGHVHKFAATDFKDTKFVNISALDRPISAIPRGLSKWRPKDCKNFNTGNYVTIEIGRDNSLNIRCIPLRRDYPKWTPLSGIRYMGIEWIPEEKKWTKESDPKLLRYDVISDPKLLGAAYRF